MSKLPTAAVISAAAVLLSACGNAEPPKPAAPPPVIERGVFTSTSDCVESGKLSAENCAKAIDMAVASHEATAPVYKSKRQCEAASGPERCGKTVDGRYRPQLQAFFVILANPPNALPLYPPTTAQIGFFAPAPLKKVIMADDESLVVSLAAATLAHENAKLPALDNSAAVGDGLGAAAADFH
jgi:hypothetical protein